MYTIAYYDDAKGEIIKWFDTPVSDIKKQKNIPSEAKKYMMWEINPDGPSTPLFEFPKPIPERLTP